MKKPTIEEIAAFIEEKGYEIDAEEFWHKNEAVGWVVGKTCKPMKSWKSTLFTWHKNIERQPKPRYNPNQNIEQMANDLGLQARPGESWDDFNRRVQRTRH